MVKNRYLYVNRGTCCAYNNLLPTWKGRKQLGIKKRGSKGKEIPIKGKDR